MGDQKDDGLQPFQRELIEGAMSVGALKFGSFTLKSGRSSPYFINAGLLCTGPLISAVATGYASLITQSFVRTSGPDSTLDFDVLFGPAYKGIPFAAATALALYTQHKHSVGYAYDRKEAKSHGEGGTLVGSPIKGKRVVILDDVMTAGTAVRQSIDMIQKEGGDVVGVVMLLDREEVTVEGRSTVKDVRELLGGAPVVPILRMRDLMTWLETDGRRKELEDMGAYRKLYGVNEEL